MPTEISRLPLHSKHQEKGARFGAFGDWEVPLYYTSILEEHHTVRNHVGIFDISHMGEFFLEGNEAAANLNRLVPRNIPDLKIGSALYTQLTNDRGGIIDDIIVYRLSYKRFLLIVNAGNVAKDAAWIQSQISGDVKFTNATEHLGLLAVQGPNSQKLMEKFVKVSGI